MLTTPDDSSFLTSLGTFAGALPVDLVSSKILIHGITLGIGVEAIILVAALLQPKTIFRIAHPLIHANPKEYCSIVSQTFGGYLQYDQNTYSDPILMIRLFLDWFQARDNKRIQIQQVYGVVKARMSHFISSARNILEKINGMKHLVPSSLSFDGLSPILSASTVTKLRLILLWNLHFNLTICVIKPKKAVNKYAIDLKAVNATDQPAMNEELFAPYFPKYVSLEIAKIGKYVYKVPTLKGLEMPLVQELAWKLFVYLAKSLHENHPQVAAQKKLNFVVVSSRNEFSTGMPNEMMMPMGKQNKRNRLAVAKTVLLTDMTLILLNHNQFRAFTVTNAAILDLLHTYFHQGSVQVMIYEEVGVLIIQVHQVPSALAESFETVLMSNLQFVGVSLDIQNDSKSQTSKFVIHQYPLLTREMFQHIYTTVLPIPYPLTAEQIEKISDSAKFADQQSTLEFKPKAPYEGENIKSDFEDVCVGKRLFNIICVGYRDK
jgi:hypothetical protein